MRNSPLLKVLLILTLTFLATKAQDFVFPVPPTPADPCYSQDSDFLQCVSTVVEQRLNGMLKDTEDAHKAHVVQCFAQYQCQPPDVSLNPYQTTYMFLKGTWRDTVLMALKTIEEIPVVVQQCMARYFKEKIRSTLSECVREKGDYTVKDYEMPEIPGFEAFDVRQIVNLISFRMLQRQQLIACVNCDPANNIKAHTILNCIESSQVTFENNSCEARLGCETLYVCHRFWVAVGKFESAHKTAGYVKYSYDCSFTSPPCKTRYKQIHQLSCSCAYEDMQEYKSSFETLLQGNPTQSGKLQQLLTELLTQFKACYAESDVEFPEENLRRLRDQIPKIAVDFIFGGGLPKEVEYTIDIAQSVIIEFASAWDGLYCSNCQNIGMDGQMEDLTAFYSNVGLCPNLKTTTKGPFALFAQPDSGGSKVDASSFWNSGSSNNQANSGSFFGSTQGNGQQNWLQGFVDRLKGGGGK